MLWTIFKENLVFINQVLSISMQVYALFFPDFHQYWLFSIRELLYQVNSILIFYKVYPFTNLSAIIIYTVFHVRESTKISRLYSSINVTSSTYTTVSWNWFSSDLIKNSNFPVYSNNTWDLAKRNQNLMESSKSSGWVWKHKCFHQPSQGLCQKGAPLTWLQ